MTRLRCIFSATVLVAVLLFGLYRIAPSAQAQQPAALVIEGGTLIDGNGGAPIADSVIVVQGNRITSVSRRGQGAAPPANARVINAGGKYVLPGLFDSQLSYAWYFGEVLIYHGITSTIDVGTSGEMAVPYRDAAIHGKFLAPRAFTSISRLNFEYDAGETGLESPFTSSRVPTTPQEARDLVKAYIAGGADYIIFDDGGLPMDIIRAGFDEAAKAGKPVFTRAYGPTMYPREAAMLGSGSLPHSAGIGLAVAKDPSKWRPGRDDRNELDRYAEMDDAKAKDLIALLVEHQVALVPTFIINFPGYPTNWTRFETEAHQLFTDKNLLAYYPQSAIDSVYRRFTNIDQGAVRERRIKGYQNASRFHKMFVDAGGRLVVSGNQNSTKAPGVDMWQEMQVMATDVGLTPMQVIQGSTKWPAEMIHKQDQLGTVEAGKLADVIILAQNPLQDIRNITTLETVVYDGKVIDRTCHANYRVPFEVGAGNFTPTVAALPWYKALKASGRGGGGVGGPGGQAAAPAVSDPANSPQPAIESITPFIVAPENGNVTVTLKGINFVKRSTVTFKGKLVPSQTVSATEIRVTLDPAALATAGRFDLVVKNPDPIDPFYKEGMWGNGTANAAHLTVNYKY
ncbi:MAG TPA: amidohydrolase family protein [Terriglobia bacterium]|nr:amidohydrolase family protein [Terriglobia bacterium]